ncbi:MAG TPA: hypothetical protein VFM02_02075 [Candidatus Paceibacterota bacterium]|nr:hypothetical protein [Candidatus Paceibacterota bacterium]
MEYDDFLQELRDCPFESGFQRGMERCQQLGMDPKEFRSQRRNYKEEVRGILGALRYREFRAEWFDRVLRDFFQIIREQGFTLESIGTSTEELHQLRRKAYRFEAFWFLHRLRRRNAGAHTFGKDLHLLNATLQNGGLSLSDVRMSSKKIEKIRVARCRRDARHFLKKIREEESSESRSRYISMLTDRLRQGEISPERIGLYGKKIASFYYKTNP